MHGNGAILQVEERELVFDIDITDYDDVRFCCSGSAICNNCWPLMQFAVKVLDAAIQSNFYLNFEHLKSYTQLKKHNKRRFWF